jgi:hypothetical protein
MKVLTAVVNNPIFIEIQNYTLKKYMKCDYEFIVFNDAKGFPDFSNGNNPRIKIIIEELCKKLDIKCINIPNEQHINEESACIRCANSMNFILEYQKQNPDKYLVIDSDMFLIDYFYEDDYKNFDCAIVLQSRMNNKYNYFWNGLYYFDITKMDNLKMLNWNLNNYDVGGMMTYWLNNKTKNIPKTEEIRWTNNNYNQDGIYYIKHLWSCTWDESEMPEKIKNNKKLVELIKNDIRNSKGKFYYEIYDNKFLHYRAGGNWERRDMKLHEYLSYKLKEVLLE